MKIMYIKKIDLDLESTFEMYWTKFSKNINTCIAMIHMAHRLACMKHVILTTVWFSLSDNFSLFSLICLICDLDLWPSDCSAVLLNCVGLFLMVTTACLVGITVFAFYAMKGCDPYTSKEIQNTNQVGRHSRGYVKKQEQTNVLTNYQCWNICHNKNLPKD